MIHYDLLYALFVISTTKPEFRETISDEPYTNKSTKKKKRIYIVHTQYNSIMGLFESKHIFGLRG